MILIFEQDTRKGPGRSFWRPGFFKGKWSGRTTWRVGWGNWSISYYPSPGLRDFFQKVEWGDGRWYRSVEDVGGKRPDPPDIKWFGVLRKQNR